VDTSDARPPPGVPCREVARALKANSSENLVALRAEHPTAFGQLLVHAEFCEACRRLIDEAFPDGFISLRQEKDIEEGLTRAEADLRGTSAETASVPTTPSEGEFGNRQRGE